MKTEIIVISDRSGSMCTLQADAEGAINSFIEQQKGGAGEARMTLVEFDGDYYPRYEGIPIEKVKKYKLTPAGSTALLDAIGRTLEEQGRRIAEQKWADLVVVMIFTDGAENSSREYSAERVKEMVAHAEKNGWSFIWQAANLDAASVARSYGSAATMSNSVGANAVGMRSMSLYASTAVLSKRSGLSDEAANLIATATVQAQPE